MKMDKQNAISLALKIRAHATHGIGHEKQVAKAKLKAHMERHGLTDVDLNVSVVKWCYFSRQQETAMIFMQVVFKVLDSSIIETKQSKKHRNLVGIECTESQEWEIRYLYDVYKRSYKEQLKDFQLAFIVKNKIFSSKNADGDTKFTKKQLENHRRAAILAEGIPVTSINKAISA